VEQDTKKQTIKTELIIVGSIFLGIIFLGVLMLFCEYHPFSQGPAAPSAQNLLGISMLISIPMILGSIGIFYVPVALIACLFVKKLWRIRLMLFSIPPIVCLLIEVGLYHIVPEFKHNACQIIVSHGQPLVDAISSYQHDHNNYPENLEALVPTYIDKIPETGVRGFPYFEYEIVDLSEYQYLPPEMRKENICELRVKLERVFKWDRIFYWPTENYPGSIYGGDVEKIGKWAYVDE